MVTCLVRGCGACAACSNLQGDGYRDCPLRLSQTGRRANARPALRSLQEFLNLWEAAKTHRRDPQPETIPVPFAFTAARYDGRLTDRLITFTAQVDLLAGGADAWRSFPVPFRGVKLTSLTLDGETAVMKGADVLVEKPGRHRLLATFEIPFARGATEFRWGIPPSAATLVTLKLPDPAMSATIAPGSGSVEHLVDGIKEVVAALGTTADVRVTLTSAAATRVAEPAVATIRATTRLEAASAETEADVAFSFPGARQDRFAISFDAGFDLADLSAPNLQSWKLRADGARQTLELYLGEPAKDALTVHLAVRRAIASLPAEGAVPAISATAARVEIAGTALLASERLELAPLPAAGLRQTPLNGAIPQGWRSAGQFAGTGSLGWRLAFAAPRREARIDYLYQVSRRQIELFASLQLTSHGDELFDTAIDVPAGFVVQTVRCDRLQDWWRDGDRLSVRFSGATPPMTALVLYLVRQETAAPAALEVKPLTLAGFHKVAGEGVIAAYKGVEAGLRLAGHAKEVAPERAAVDYQVLAPIERKRGFTFSEQDFTAQVTLTPAPAKLLALWAMDAEAHEGWTSLSTKVRIDLRQGSTGQVRFTLPAALPEARVSGADVRETRSRVEGGSRVFEVQFQKDIYDEVEFTVDLELPATGETTLPVIVFPEAQRSTGYVLVDNASEGEMTLSSSGVDPATASEVPWLPDLSRNARIFRVQPGWSVKVKVERLERATARAAFCAWADLTTALRADGTEWMRAVWHLQNRALQFLPVHLPEGVELMSVRVAGQSVRADAGTAGGQAAILVPLIKTKPGELSYDVEMVYRASSSGLGLLARRKFNDPELIGITVERTFWHVWLPPGWRLRGTDGNMEPVIGEVASAEKLYDSLDELKSLGAIANSSGVEDSVRHKALTNFNQLWNSIETSNLDASGNRGLGREANGVRQKEAEGQGAYVQSKRQAINAELNKEKALLGDLAKRTKAADAPASPPSLSSKPALGLLFKNTEPSNWRANSSSPQQPAPNPAPTSPSSDANSSRLYLNDNVVLQQQVQAEPAKTEAGTTPTKGLSQPAATTPEIATQSLEGGLGGRKPASQNANQTAVFNTARGNAFAAQDKEAGANLNQQQAAAAFAAPNQVTVNGGIVLQPPAGHPKDRLGITSSTALSTLTASRNWMPKPGDSWKAAGLIWPTNAPRMRSPRVQRIPRPGKSRKRSTRRRMIMPQPVTTTPGRQRFGNSTKDGICRSAVMMDLQMKTNGNKAGFAPKGGFPWPWISPPKAKSCTSKK